MRLWPHYFVYPLICPSIGFRVSRKTHPSLRCRYISAYINGNGDSGEVALENLGISDDLGGSSNFSEAPKGIIQEEDSEESSCIPASVSTSQQDDFDEPSQVSGEDGTFQPSNFDEPSQFSGADSTVQADETLV